MSRPRGELDDVQRVALVGPREAEGEIAAVGRPALVVDLLIRVGGDDVRRATRDRDGEQPVRAVGHRQRAAIGREDRPVEERARHMGEQALGAAGRRAHGQLLLAARIRGVGDERAVGRPGGVVLVRARGAGEVAHRSVLGRHREDVAAGREQHPLAVGRDVEIGLLGRVGRAHGVERLDRARLGAGAVIGHVDGERVQLPARQVEDVEPAREREGDPVRAAARAERGKADVIVGEVGDLRRGPRREVVRPDVRAP